MSSILYTASVEDDGKTISCYNPESGKVRIKSFSLHKTHNNTIYFISIMLLLS